MFKTAPDWYIALMKAGVLVGLLGIFPAIRVEAIIWGVADGQIVVWLMIVLLVSILMPLIFTDTRRLLLGEAKSK